MVAPMIVCFEGLDGCGKSTAIKLLKQYLESERFSVKVVEMIGNPGIKRLLAEDHTLTNYQRILILRAAFDDAAVAIDAALEEGSFVLLDRGLASYFAYNAYGAANGFVDQHRNIEMIKKLLRAYPVSFTPDVVFHLKSDYETMVLRRTLAGAKPDAIESTLTEKRYNTISRGFDETLKENLYADFVNFGKKVYEIDANKKPRMVAAMASMHLSEHFF